MSINIKYTKLKINSVHLNIFIYKNMIILVERDLNMSRKTLIGGGKKEKLCLLRHPRF